LPSSLPVGAMAGQGHNNFYLWGTWKTRVIREPFLTKKVNGQLRKVVLGESFVIALTEKGKLVSWGRDLHNGCLGLGNDDQGQQIHGRDSPQEIDLNGVTDVQMGTSHVVALTQEGKVYCWGNGAKGQLGNSKTENKPVNKPMKVETLESENITQIAVVKDSTFALSTNGNVWAWGDNHNNTLGLEDATRLTAPQPMRLTLLGESRVRRLEIFEGKTIIAHLRAKEGDEEEGVGDLEHGEEEKELEVFKGIDEMRKAMEKTQEWWNHLLNIRHGQPYDMPHDAAIGVGQEAAAAGAASPGSTARTGNQGAAAAAAVGGDLHEDMGVELEHLQRAQRHLDSLVRQAVEELRRTQKMPGTRNVRFILCMFIDECRLRREKVMRTISARQLVDAKRQTQEISAYSVIDFGANANEEIRKIIAVTKQLTQMLEVVRSVHPVDVLSLELKVTLIECLECKLQLHDTRVELLKEVKGKPSDPMLPALRTIRERWVALKNFSLYKLYQEEEAKRYEFHGNDDEHLAYLVKASNAQIDQMLQIDKDKIISHDTLVPALCYDLLRENAELRKMTNNYQLHVLLLYNGLTPSRPERPDHHNSPTPNSSRVSEAGGPSAAHSHVLHDA